MILTAPYPQTEPLNSVVSFSRDTADQVCVSVIPDDFYQKYVAPHTRLVNFTMQAESRDDNRLVLRNTDSLTQKMARIVGDNGAERYTKFESYGAGWDGADAKPLSYRSVAVMEYFLEQFSEFSRTPSIFLLESGNLQLGWEDSQDNTVEVEFAPERLVYFIEALNREGEIHLGSAEEKELINIIKGLS